MNSSSPSQDKDTKRSCTDCQTTTTPLWRGGPAGPRVINFSFLNSSIFCYMYTFNLTVFSWKFLNFQSLCNACGIRYRKKRRDLLGLNKGEAKRKKKKSIESSSSELGVSLNELGLMAIQTGITVFEESMLKEEEQAAIMLMALSSESFGVFA